MQESLATMSQAKLFIGGVSYESEMRWRPTSPPFRLAHASRFMPNRASKPRHQEHSLVPVALSEHTYSVSLSPMHGRALAHTHTHSTLPTLHSSRHTVGTDTTLGDAFRRFGEVTDGTCHPLSSFGTVLPDLNGVSTL